MAAMVKNRMATEKGIGFFRQYFNLITRTLSSSPPPKSLDSSASAAAAAIVTADPTKVKHKKKNLFEVAQFLPNWGIDYKMAKSHWRDVSYQITKINLYKDGRHGKAWGIRHKAGLAVADAPTKIGGVHKRGWKYFPETKKSATNKTEEPTPA